MTGTSEQTTSKRRVIVTDDMEDCHHANDHPQPSRFEARAVFSGGKQVVELLDSFQPEMLIVDVVMPGMTGIEAAIAVRSKFPDCKIILFSGHAATADLLDQAKTQGYEFEIVVKPIHSTDLLAKLGVATL